jgi:hypothetical protein
LLPLEASVPLQPSPLAPPLAVQLAPGVAVHVSVTAVPAVVVAELELIETPSAVDSGTASGTPATGWVSVPAGLVLEVGA